jgi:hypothetical protein
MAIGMRIGPPSDRGMALGTVRLLSAPVNPKLFHGIGPRHFLLPAAAVANRSHQGYSPLRGTLDQQVRRDVARVGQIGLGSTATLD